jgi:hypothetical protein
VDGKKEEKEKDALYQDHASLTSERSLKNKSLSVFKRRSAYSTKRHARTAGRAHEKTNKPDKAKLFPKTFRKLEKKKGHRNPFYVMRE